jgi:hypothetical protein
MGAIYYSTEPVVKTSAVVGGEIVALQGYRAQGNGTIWPARQRLLTSLW